MQNVANIKHKARMHLFLLKTILYLCFKKYGRRSGHSFFICKFFLDGKRIWRFDTPKMHEMEQDDVIDVFIDYQGGNGNTENRRIYDISTPCPNSSRKKIDVFVQDQTGANLIFRMDMNTLMEILMFEV